MLATLKREIRQIGRVTLYFFLCFTVILTLKKLLLAAYEVEVTVLFSALVGAVVLAKVVVVMDMTHVATRLDSRLPLGVTTLYKTAIYTLVSLVVLAAEKVFHGYRETGTLGRGFAEVWARRDRNEILARLLCLGLAFAAYHLFAGIDRRLGEGTLWRLVKERGKDRKAA